MLEKGILNSMRRKFTQGSIIQDIRSTKYNLIRCKGIVITARCDIAQEKISHFHCLSALSLEEWIYEVLFNKIYKNYRKSQKENLSKKLSNFHLDFDTIINYDLDNIKLILFANIKKTKEREKILDEIKKYIDYNNWGKDDDHVPKNHFLKLHREEVKCELKNLNNSKNAKYCFIPQNAYIGNGIVNDGIVVDLQDIYQIPYEYVAKIDQLEMDYCTIKNIEERTSINQYFYFEDEKDFIIADEIIKSPEIEHLLQMFANVYSRVGVDNASQQQMEEFCDKFINNIN